MSKSTLHRSHPETIARPRRAEGHLRTIIGMIEGERACLEIAQARAAWGTA